MAESYHHTGPLNIFIDLPRLWTQFLLTPNFNSEQSSCMFVWNVFYVFIKSRLFQNFCFKYNRLNDFKFEIPKIFWGGAHRAPSPDPFPCSFSCFALDLGFARFRPSTFDGWLRPCHEDKICKYLCPTSAEWMRKNHVSKDSKLRILKKNHLGTSKINLFSKPSQGRQSTQQCPVPPCITA